MKNFGIIRNSIKDPAYETTRMISEHLSRRGAVVREVMTEQDIIPEMEALLVLGGDGTMLRAAKLAVSHDLPMLGINLGTLGYLAEVNRDRILPALDKLLRNEFTVEERMMLTGEVYHGRSLVCRETALNDIVISREGAPRVILFKNYVNGEFLNVWQADAIIMSTATGSTGYALSAGGPIISPTASLIMMTPLAPHTLNARSIIFPSTDELMTEIGRGRTEMIERARVDFDGAGGYAVETGDTIVVSQSRKRARIIKIRSVSFLEVLRNKLSNN
ncbi:MAG: NAD(+)/NADH kinase [Lachnospiraceae bacterium]|nr:NAD(+)/NADH kinase [Lachnospiraceae bacterium]